jgi:autotransporter-associated beta strand protein
MCWTSLAGAQAVPINGTGYDYNIVVGLGQLFTTPGSLGGITATMDGGTAGTGNTWYALGQNTAASSTGLPMGTTFTSTSADTAPLFNGNNSQFTLQNTGTNNAIFVASNGSLPKTGTFTLTTPGNYSAISFVGADGNGANSLQVTFNYVGGTSYTTTASFFDWFPGSTAQTAYVANGRVASGGYANVNGNNPRISFFDVYSGGTAAGGGIQSISVVSLSATNSGTHFAIMGVSGLSAITWTGTTSNNWNFADANWTGGSPYTDGSQVIFDATGTNTNVNIGATVQPSGVTFNNAASSYTFSGASISGTGAVVLNPTAGSVSFNSANAYGGATLINGGNLILGNSGAAQNSTVIENINNGLLFALGNTTVTLGGLSGGGSFSLTDAAGIAVALSVGNNNLNTAAFSGVMSGSGSLTKIGTGRTTLTGANTYTGPTFVNGGTLTIQNNSVPSANIVISSSAMLQYNATSNFTQNATTISGGGVLQKIGGSTLTFAAAGQPVNWNLGSGAVLDVEGGTLVGGSNIQDNWTTNLASLNIGSTAATFTGVEANVMVDALTGVGTFSGGYPGAGYTADTIGVNNGSGTFSGTIKDWQAPLNLVKAGTGLEILQGNNTFSGTTTVTGGTLMLNNVGALGSSTYNSSGGGLLTFGTTAATLGGLQGSGNLSMTNTAGGAVNLTVGTNGISSTYSGALSDSSLGATLTKSGTGILTLTNAGNTYTGATTISSGTLQLAGAGALNGGTYAAGVTNNAALAMNTSTNQYFTGPISGSGNLYQQGGGVTTLGVSNSYTGITNITGGTLALGDPGALGGSTLDSNITGTLTFGGLTNAVLGGLTGPGNLSLVNTNGAAVNISIGNNSSSTTYSGILNDSNLGATLTKIGNGTLTLTNSGMNTSYTGSTTVTGGFLAYGGWLPSYTVNLAGGGVKYLNDGTGSNTTINALAAVSLVASGTHSIAAGAFATSNSGNTLAIPAINNGNSLNNLNSQVNFTATNGYAISIGTLNLSGGTGASTTLNPTSTTLSVGKIVNNATSGGPDTVNLGGTTVGNTVTGSIGNGLVPTALVVSGGAWTLNSANTYTGGTTISGGTLFAGGGAPSSGVIQLYLPGTIGVASPNAAGVLSQTSSDSNGVLALTNNDNETLTLSNSVSLGSIGSNTYSGTLTPLNNIYFLGGGGGNLTYAPALPGGNSLVVPAPGNVILANTASVVTGTTTIASGGTLQIPNSLTLQTSDVTTNGAVTFAPGLGTAIFGSLSGGGSFPLADTSGGSIALTIGGNNNAITTFSGVMSGNGSLTKVGSGITVLTGASTYTGGSNLNGGIVAVGSLSLGGTAASALGTSTKLSFNGGTMFDPLGNFGAANPSGTNVTLANAQGWNQNITLNSGGGTLQLANGFLAFTGALIGSGNLTIAGTRTDGQPGPQVFFNTASLNNGASFTGNIILAAGGDIQYRTNAPNAFGTTANVTIQTGGVFSNDNGYTAFSGTNGYNTTSFNTLQNAFILNGGSLATQGVNITYAGPVTITGGTTSYIGDYTGSGGSLVVSGALLGSGSVSTIGTTAVTLSSNISGFTGVWQSWTAATTLRGAAAAGNAALTWATSNAGYNFTIGNGTVNFGALTGPGGTIQSGTANTLTTLSVGALGASTTFGGSLANGSGTLGLSLVGGNLTLNGASPLTGPIAVNPGATLQLGDGVTNNGTFSATRGSSVGNITNNSAVVIANPNQLSWAGIVSGSGSVLKTGTGTLVLNSVQTYTGPTTIAAGTVQLPSPGVSTFGGTGAGWTVNLAGTTFGSRGISGNVLTLTNTTGQSATAWDNTLVTPVNGFHASFTFQANGQNNPADGACFILQNDVRGATAVGGGGGAWAYTGANNTNAAPAILNSVGININFFPNAISQTGFCQGGIVTNIQNIVPTGGTGATNFFTTGDPINVSVNYNPSTQIMAWSFTDTANNATYNFSQSSVNLTALLGGSNAYVGFTGATGGAWENQFVSNFSYSQSTSLNNALPTGTALTMAGGVLDLDGNNQTVGSLAGAGTVTNSAAATTSLFAAGGNNSSTVYSGVLTDGAGTLAVRKQGSGNWTLASNNAYSGATSVNSGTLQVGTGGNTGSIGSGAVTTNGVLAFNRSDSVTLSTTISGSGSVAQIGGGTLAVTADNGYTGGTVINNGMVQVGNAGTTGSLGTGPISNNGAVVFNRTDDVRVASALSGSGAVYQVGGGSISLRGNAASYTGPVTISSGNLYINSSNAASSVAVGPGSAPFTLGGSGTLTAATATVADGGNIEAGIEGHGSLTLAGLNFQNTANVFVSNLTNYQTNAAVNVTGSNALTAQGNASSITFFLGGAAPLNTSPKISHLLQYSGAIQSGGLASPGFDTSGIIGLSSRAQFQIITSNPGFIDLQYVVDYPIWTGNGNQIWTTSLPTDPPTNNWKLASSSGTANFLVNDIAAFDDSATNTSVNIGAGDVFPSAVLFNNNTKTYVISGTNSIAGNTAVNINGNGTVTISNSNSYYGGTIVNAGRLNIGNAEALGSAGLGGVLTLNGGSLNNSTGGALTTDNYGINWNGNFTFVGGNPLNLGNGAVTLGNSAAVNVAASTLTLAGVINDADQGFGFTKSGPGVLVLLGSSTYTGATSVSGGTLQVGNGGSGASIASTSGINVGSGATVIFNDTDNVTISSSITGAGQVRQQAGLLALTNSNSFTGGISVNGGTLQLSNGGPTGTLAPNSTVTVQSGATLQLSANGALGSSGSATIVTLNDGVATVDAGDRVTLWNTVNSTGGTLASAAGNGDGNGNYSLSGQVNATSDGSGNPAVIAATQVSLATNTTLHVTRGSALGPDLVVSSLITSLSAGSGLTVNGTGITQFTGANTYNGGTTVSGGTLQLGNNSALGTGGLTVSSGALVDINGFSPSIGALNGNGLIDNATASGTPTLTIGNGSTNGTFSGTIRNTTGIVTLVKAGASIQVLNGTNTYTGGTNLNGGELNFNSASALPYTISPPNINFGGGALQWATGNTLDVSNGIAPIPGGVSAGIDTNGNNLTFGTSLSGSGGLTKLGAGVLTLTQTNGYPGATNITGGTVSLANVTALQNSTVNLNVTNGLTFSSAPTLGGLSGSASLNMGANTVTIGANNGYAAYSGTLSGSGGLTKIGNGVQVLTGANSYGGATNISGGILRLSAAPIANPVTTGLLYQLDAASSGGYQVNGGSVTQFNDVSGSNNNFVATSGTAGPNVLTGTNGMNNLNVLHFSGSNQLVLNSSTTPEEVFIANRVTAPGSAANNAIWGQNGTDFGIKQQDTLDWRYGSGDRHDYANGSTGVMYLNGLQIATTANAAFITNTAQLLEAANDNVAPFGQTGLGFYNPAGGRFFTGDVGEVLAFSSTLSTAQRQAVEAYLMNKWEGVQAGYAANNVLPTNTPVTISGGGALDLTNGVQTIRSLSSTDGNGSQILLGASGVLTIAGGVNNTYDGAIYASGGTVALPSGSLTLTGVGPLQSNIVNNASLVFAPAATQTYSGVISGSGPVTKTGVGTTVFGANNTYTGPTLVNNGTLQLGPVPVINPNLFSLSGFGSNTTGGTTGSINNGTWTFNTSGTYSSTPVTGGTLTLTDNVGNLSRSAFYNTPVPVPSSTAFHASFVYRDVTTNGADGIAFMLQNSSNGTAALGGGGGAIGYNGISPSIGMGINIYAGANGGNHLYWLENGAVASTFATGNVNTDSGDPILINLNYDGSSVLSVTFSDLTNSNSYTNSIAVGSVSALLGSTSAYVGFSGATGGVSAQQIVTGFNYGESGISYVPGTNILPAATALTVAPGATTDLSGGSQTIGSISGAGLVTSSNSGAVAKLTLGGTGSSTFNGSINDGAGQVALAVTNGSLTLTGTDTYSGGTLVDGGTLIVTNNEAIADGSSLTVGSPSAFPAPVVPSAPVSGASAAPVASVPEPATLALLASLLGSAAVYRHMRRRRV